MQKDPPKLRANPPAQSPARALRELGSEPPDKPPQVDITFRMGREEVQSSLPVEGRERLKPTPITGCW